VRAAFGGPDEEQPLVVVEPPLVRLRDWPLDWRPDAARGALEAAPAVPVAVERVELECDADALRSLRLEARTPGDVDFQPLRAWPLRPGRIARQRAGSPKGQIYVVWPAVTAAAIRIRPEGPFTRIAVSGGAH
jgi:hypothetical protein